LAFRLAVELAETFGKSVLLWHSSTPRTAGSRGSLRAVRQAGAGTLVSLIFGFFGSAGSFAAFENVLLSRSRGLHHLVVSAVGFFLEGAPQKRTVPS